MHLHMYCTLLVHKQYIHVADYQLSTVHVFLPPPPPPLSLSSTLEVARNGGIPVFVQERLEERQKRREEGEQTDRHSDHEASSS